MPVTKEKQKNMNQLYIPAIADVITLALPWTFSLYCEQRNGTLIRGFGVDSAISRNGKPITPAISYYAWQAKDLQYKGATIKDNRIDEFTIPAGAQLAVSRIYIRQGQPNFNSITFKLLKGTCAEIVDSSGLPYPLRKNGIRFWVKLQDANKLLFI